MEDTDTIAALRAQIAALEAQNAELLGALAEARRDVDMLRQTLEAVPGVVWQTEGVPGTEGARMVYMNKRSEQILGHSREDWFKTPSFGTSIMHPDDKPAFLARSPPRRDGPVPDHRLIAKDGREVWIELHVVLLRDASGEAVGAAGVALDVTARKLADEERLRLQEEVIRAQAAALEVLSTPLIPISAEVLVMPLVGAVDRARAERVIEALLQGLTRARARFAIIDITGVGGVDAQTADALLRAARAVRLLGAEVVLTGVRPDVARALVALGTELGGIVTCGSLEGGIAYASRRR